MTKMTNHTTLLALGLVLFLSACDGGQDVQDDGGLDDGGLQDAGLDAGLDAGGGDEGVQYWGECPFPYTQAKEHLLRDEWMGLDRVVPEVYLRCTIQFETLDAEVFIKARPVALDRFIAEYEVDHAYVCRAGAVEEISSELASFSRGHHSWKSLEIVIDTRRYAFNYSEMCEGARPCTPWPDQFEVRNQADSSLIAEGQPTLCAGVGVTGLPVPFVAQVRIPPEGASVSFTMGSTEGDSDEAPENTFDIRPNRMDLHEATNEEYAFFLNDNDNDCDGQSCADTEAASFKIHRVDGVWTADAGFEDLPVVHVNWFGADAYCRWRRMILPSEGAWEFAASALGERTYPWGEEAPDCSRVLYDACAATGPESICGKPTGNSREGICNLAGNLSEWIEGWYQADLYQSCADDHNCGTGPLMPTEMKVIRGGSYLTPEHNLRASDRNFAAPESARADLGLRCMAGNPS